MGDPKTTLLRYGYGGIRWLSRAVFPETCAGCGVAGSWMCEVCSEELEEIGMAPSASGSDALGLGLDAAGVEHPASEPLDIRSRFVFAGPVRQAVHLLKYEGESARAAWFGEILLPLVSLEDATETVLVPVPLTAARERRRGYNQSSCITSHLSRVSGLETIEGLTRVRETLPQVGLAGIERIENVRGAFTASAKLRDRHVIVVDDVVTTGATMRECLQAARAIGAASVRGITATAGIHTSNGRHGYKRR